MSNPRRPFRPLVTIVIPVYNGANYLAEAIDSALAQTYDNLEVLVVDDGSTDGGATAQVARSYGDRITYVHKPNGGTATALNEGIARMRGEYFSWLSHDDRYPPYKVARQVEALAEAGGTPAVVFGNYRFLDERLERETFRSTYDASLLRSMPCAMVLGVFSGCTLLVPRSAFQAHGVFDPKFITTQDYDMWLRLVVARVPFLFVPEVCIDTRIHGGQDTVKKAALVRREGNEIYTRMARHLTPEEVRAFSDDPVGYLDDQLMRFVAAGYKDAAVAVLQAALRLDRPGERWAVDERLLGARLGLARPEQARALLPRLHASPRRRVVHVGGAGAPGNEHLVAALAAATAAAHDTVLVDIERPHPKSPTDVARLDLRPVEAWPAALPVLGAGLAADLVVIHPNHLPGLPPAYQGLTRLGVRTIAVHHGSYLASAVAPLRSPLLLGELRSTCAAADAVVWPGRSSAALSAVSCDRTYHLPAPLAPVPDPGPRPRGSPPRLLVVRAHLDSPEQAARLLAAFERLLLRHPDARLTLVGPDAPGGPSVGQLLDQRGPARGQVDLVEEAPDADALYRGADLLLHTSEREGRARVLLEAGLRRLPVVATEHLDLEDVLVDGQNGRVVLTGDIDGLADAASTLLDDDAGGAAMGARAREMALRFTYEAVVGRWLRLFDAVLEHGREAARAAGDDRVRPSGLDAEGLRRLLVQLDSALAVAAREGTTPRQPCPPATRPTGLQDVVRDTINSMREGGLTLTGQRIVGRLGRLLEPLRPSSRGRARPQV